MARMGRPPTGRTPKRNIRVPDEIWQAALDRAAENGETVTAVVVRALKRYAARPRSTPPEP